MSPFVRLDKVKYQWATKGRKVCLIEDLPTDRLFGNVHPLPARSAYGHLQGEVVSEGFEGGLLRVGFHHSVYGSVVVRFNQLSAVEFLGLPC